MTTRWDIVLFSSAEPGSKGRPSSSFGTPASSNRRTSSCLPHVACKGVSLAERPLLMHSAVLRHQQRASTNAWSALADCAPMHSTIMYVLLSRKATTDAQHTFQCIYW